MNNFKEIYDCIIVGAGAAGLFCSASFTSPVKGLILEKTSRPGTKLLMSGGGQCNITHSGSIKDFIRCYGENGTKIRSILYRYNNLQLMEFLCRNGVRTASRSDGKIFPESEKADDILQALLKKSHENGFRIIYGESTVRITRICGSEDNLWQVETEKGCRYEAKNLILACGGCSYPSTGSDGSIFAVITDDFPGLEVVPLKPALTSVQAVNYPYSTLSGISFTNAYLSVWRKQKKIMDASGDLLFTHRDFSGPLILNHSRYIETGDTIMFNYLYPMDRKTLLQKISGSGYRLKGMHNELAAATGLPKNFLKLLMEQSGKNPKVLAERLTEDRFTVEGTGGFKRAMATAGGVSLSEIETKTMECRKYPGLFIIGEMVDITGETGGYNLQFAYSSARAASDSVLKRLSPK